MRGKNKMPLNLASPGIVVREVDLTVGRVDPTSSGVGAIVAPFAQGPVDLPTVIGSEKDLLDVFGKPYSTDKHYEHWLVASSYLAYGGALSVVRADDSSLQNSFVGTATSIKIKSLEHYEDLGYDENPITNVVVAARNPGSWANGLRVGIIDARADQILGINTGSVSAFTAIVEDRIGTSVGSASTVGISTGSIVLGQTVRSSVVSSGTIVTDWYSINDNSKERYKVNIYIIGKELTSHSLKVSVYKRIIGSNGNWNNQYQDSNLAEKIKTKIIERARELKVSESEVE